MWVAPMKISHIFSAVIIFCCTWPVLWAFCKPCVSVTGMIEMLCPDSVEGSWIIRSTFGEGMEDALMIAHQESNIVWWEHFPTLEIEASHHWREAQCREILRLDAAISRNPMSPQPETRLCPTRWQCSPPQCRLSQNLGVAMVEWPASSPDLNPINPVGSAWVCRSCQTDQHNYVGWIGTNSVWRMGCHPTTVWDQHEEEVPGPFADFVHAAFVYGQKDFRLLCC